MTHAKINRRQMMTQSVGTTTALMIGAQFPSYSFAAGDQQTFTGFDGQTVVWGGISYLPKDGSTALPNFLPLLDKTDPSSGIPILNNVLTKELESVDPAVWKAKDFKLSIAEGGQDGTARYGMIMAVAAELTIQNSRTDINSFSVLRLIAYNFVFNVDSRGGRKVIASYPVGGRVYEAKEGFDATPIGDYYERMFTTKSANGDTIANFYSQKLKEFKFDEIKLGLDYRVKAVKLNPEAKAGLQALGLAEQTFTDWIGSATTMSYGEKLKVSMIPFQDSRASTGDLALNFRGKEAFRLTLPEGDVKITPRILEWKIGYSDHPRDKNQFAQEINIWMQITIQFVFDDPSVRRFKQVFQATEVQSVFKEKEYRRSDAATIFLLIEQILDKAFEAIARPEQRDVLLKGYKKVFPSTQRNREIQEYISVKVDERTAATFDRDCRQTLDI